MLRDPSPAVEQTLPQALPFNGESESCSAKPTNPEAPTMETQHKNTRTRAGNFVQSSRNETASPVPQVELQV